MDSKIKVSFIVPVYKVEKYLRRGMDSLVNQTLDGIEIICVNDGSPDNCLNILKEYQEKYPNRNIVIIDKKNEGLWKARLDGVGAARGQYIAFIDPDDYLALDYTEKLYNAIRKDDADICICGYDRMEETTKHKYSTEMTQYAGKVVDMNKNPEDILSINGSVWNKLYKAEILKPINNLKNPPIILEDITYLLLAFLRVKKITFIGDRLYYYMMREGSVINTFKKEHIEPTERAMLEIKSIYENNPQGKRLLPVLDVVVFLHFGISLMSKIYMDKTCKFKETLKKNKEFLDLNFTTWRKSKYLKISYCIKNKFSNIRIAIIKKVYIMNLYKAFLRLYTFMINKLKIDIKW